MKKTIEEEVESLEKEVASEIKYNKSQTANAIIIGSLIIAASIFAGLYFFGGSKNENKDFVDPDKMYSGEAFKKEEYLYGNGDKKVVLVEFSDLECPFCKKLHTETLKDIYKNYGNKLDIVYKHFPLPFHTKAPQESVATMCARDIGGQNAYRTFIEKIYEKTEGNDTLDLATLPAIANEAGVDVEKFNSCMSNASSTAEKLAQVQKDMEEGSASKVDGTPATLVLLKDGDSYQILTMISGARDYKYFSKVLDQALKQ